MNLNIDGRVDDYDANELDDHDDDEDVVVYDDYDDDDDSKVDRVAVMSTKISCVEPVTKNKYIVSVAMYNEEDHDEGDAWTVEGSVHCLFSHSQRITGVALIDALIHSFVSSTASTSKEEEVGSLSGTLLDRPNPSFFSIADDINGELIQLAMHFCEADGTVRLNHPELKSHNGDGGFFHIYQVAMHPDHSGRNLGVRMVYEALKLLPWTLAVMVPGVLGRQSPFAFKEVRNSIRRFYYQSYDEHPSEQEIQSRDAASMKVYLQFARLGFAQAGKNPEDCESFFLTKKMFQETIFAGDVSHTMEMYLLTKEHVAANADIYVRPRRHKPSALDVMLDTFVLNQNDLLAQAMERLATPPEETKVRLAHMDTICGDETVPEEIRQKVRALREEYDQSMRAIASEARNDIHTSLIKKIPEMLAKGATMDGVRILHNYAANVSNSHTDPGILKLLVEFGATADLKDEFGVTPLMTAATYFKSRMIDFLISMGADRSARSLSDKTPMDHWLSAYRSRRGDYSPFGLRGLNDLECVSVFEAAKALMPKCQRDALVDGTVPPKVLHKLSITADLQVQKFSDIGTFDSAAFGENPILAVQQVNRYQLDFIPLNSISWDYDPQEEYWRILLSGYRTFWKATSQVVGSGRAPTVDRVREACRELKQDGYPLVFQNGMSEPLGFENWGGVNIEYCLDALFEIASLAPKEGAVVTRDDGLPENPLDDCYDVLWNMCVVRGGGVWEKKQKRGPFEVEWEKACFVRPGDENESDDENE
jgi:ribosomal protein S18 acetylase RimI-like enzyme